MKTYTITNQSGMLPVGFSAIVRARNVRDAIETVSRLLPANGVRGEIQAEDVEEFPAGTRERVRFLNFGHDITDP